ncbi:MAG TPA: SUMF1/EgtB/PvdO family nonheme iron enzyme [Thermogutta sp.]|nr:SUMF1/EgtB/PvdO family nonheme iron enzyme [Thermogutta sp.]
MSNHKNKSQWSLAFILEVVIGCCCLLGSMSVARGQVIVRQWEFNRSGDAEGWKAGGHLSDTHVADGVLRTKVIDWDPILVHDVFEPPLPATATQVIEIRLFAPHAGQAEFFWTNTTEGQYGGFAPGKETPFAVKPGWNTYRVQPFWQAEGKIVRLRFDLPSRTANEEPSEYQIDYIRILELAGEGPPGPAEWDFAQGLAGWQLEGDGKLWWENGCLNAEVQPGARLVAPPIQADADQLAFVAMEMAVDQPGSARLIWASGKVNGQQSTGFTLRAGERFAVYNLPVAGTSNWKTPVIYLALELTSNHRPVRLRLKWLKLSEEPGGPPDLELERFFVKDALPRVDKVCNVVAHVTNRGGEPVRDVRAELILPDGAEFVDSASPLRHLAELEFGETEALVWKIKNRRVGPVSLRLRIVSPELEEYERQEEFLPDLRLPREDYVPEPKPVRGPFEVGVYYFPGWGRPSSWQPIERFPERRPVLGFYREGLPEIADWHIKWAVEHGITFFCYDWYWRQGERRLEHALHDGFFQARYRHLMKFCLLWANHFGPGEHSAEDNERVCKYWIDNYFRRPEYFKVEGRPLLVIFSVHSMQRDLGIEGTRKAIELWHRMTEEAGVGKILVAGCGTPANLKQMKEMGFDAVTGYNWPSCGIQDRNWVPFSEVAANYDALWWRPLAEAGAMPVITPVSAGWDSRPWHGDRALVLTDCTPQAFQQHLEDAKRFIEETGQPRVLLIEAWNEFGEGSYCEPHKQYGFGHLEAIRKVFAPDSQPPLHYGPEDVGRPLLEFRDLEKPVSRTQWNFDTPDQDEGWKPLMGLTDVTVANGVLAARTISGDPAFHCSTKLRAKDFAGIEITIAMRSSKPTDIVQLFWATLSNTYREEASVRTTVVCDGKMRTYRLDLAGHPLWRGVITGFRLDVGSQPDAEIKIDSIRLIRSASEAFENLRRAIDDLIATFGASYPEGQEFRRRLDELEQLHRKGQPVEKALSELQRKALLANPLLDFDRLLVLKRKRGQLGLPTNHQCNSCLDQTGYDNELAIFSWRDGTLKTLYRPPQGFYVGEVDLHWDADRLLFTMPTGQTWQIYEMRLDGTGLRRVSREEPGVDNFDACYLPDGGIAYASTAAFTAVPCWHGRERACAIFRMEADGSGVRQLCFDQDLDLHPAVLPNGQIIFSRWDYTGIMHIYLRPLMVMNPDGTQQRAIYGSNSYYPNALYFPRAVPGQASKLVAILSGYHGVNRAGDLVLLDYGRGWHEAKGIVHRFMHGREPIEPIIRDDLVGPNWPKFLHPYPLSENYVLVSAQLHQKGGWGIYLVDRFDNMIPILVDEQYDFFEPIPIRKQPRPPVIPPRVDLSDPTAVVFLQDVYRGPGLKGVPRGTIKNLRIVAYHWGFPGMAGPDKVGRAGPWDVMRILGTVPVEEDGSALFRIPANTPIAIQALDENGAAVQIMRSWYTAMPGEQTSCIGCHEPPTEAPQQLTRLVGMREPVDIKPWYGPPRGFDFEREIQPVLDKYCVGCHDGQGNDGGRLDLRALRFHPDYQGLPLSQLGASRLWPEVAALLPSCEPPHRLLGNKRYPYTPAYEALIPFVRRVNIEDDVYLLNPCEYSADTSELIQMLKKGHYGVELDPEAWDRLQTWIDLNGPCHGRWGVVCPVPQEANKKRLAILKQSGGPDIDPEELPDIRFDSQVAKIPERTTRERPPRPQLDTFPLSPDAALARQQERPWTMTITVSPGIDLELVRIPSGRFVMGDPSGDDDENPACVVSVEKDFWISRYEITNEQYRCFDPAHDSRVFTKRSINVNGPGVAMNEAKQPVVRVSWEEAMSFCRWLSERTHLRFRLPTEAEWEYACRAGTATAFFFGDRDSDFSQYANLADAAIERIYTTTGGVVVLQPIPADTRWDDGAIATKQVGSYRPNAWGLYDMHGNAAEWTLSLYRPYPYREDDGRNDLTVSGFRVVRGGSFYDRPQRARSAFRLFYRQWQRVHNVGFRVVCQIQDQSDLPVALRSLSQ